MPTDETSKLGTHLCAVGGCCLPCLVIGPGQGQGELNLGGLCHVSTGLGVPATDSHGLGLKKQTWDVYSLSSIKCTAAHVMFLAR